MRAGEEVFSVGHVIYLPARRLSFFRFWHQQLRTFTHTNRASSGCSRLDSLRATPNKFDGMISIVGFWGSDLALRKADAFNLESKNI